MELGYPGKGAMIIMPTVKQLQDLGLVGGTKDDPKTLTQAEAAMIAQQGITVIGDKGNFNNWLFKDAFISPAEARMNLAGSKGIKYNDPLGNGYYHITPNMSGTNISSFNMTGKFMQRNPNTGAEEWFDINRTSIPLGGELDNVTQNTKEAFNLIDKQNNNIYRNFNPKK
jgi:hypothetical protein